MKKLFFILTIVLLSCIPAYAGSQAEALLFFHSYVNSANNYDENLLDYYSKNAVIKRVVIRPDGSKGTATFEMKDYAIQLKLGQATARMRKYKNYYSDIKANKTGKAYKITCLRQPTGEKYKLNAYFIISDASGKWQITEEMMETKVQIFNKYVK